MMGFVTACFVYVYIERKWSLYDVLERRQLERKMLIRQENPNGSLSSSLSSVHASTFALNRDPSFLN